MQVLGLVDKLESPLGNLMPSEQRDTYKSDGAQLRKEVEEQVQNVHVVIGDLDGLYVGSTVGKSDMKENPKRNI